MKRNPEHTGKANHGRRRALQQGVALGAAIAGAPWVLRYAHAQGAPDLGAYQKAKINWRLAEGQRVTVAVIPAGYFQNLTRSCRSSRSSPASRCGSKGAAGPDPAEGDARPLEQDRHLGDARGRSDVLPLYAANRWIDAARSVSSTTRSSPTRPGSTTRTSSRLARRRHRSTAALRHSLRRRGDGADLSQGRLRGSRPEAGRDARGLRPSRQGVHDPANRLWGAALRGFHGAGQNMYIYPSILRAFGGKWFDRRQDRGERPRGRSRRSSGTSRLQRLRARGRRELELARHRRRVRRRARSAAYIDAPQLGRA